MRTLIIGAILSLVASAAAETRLLRFPDLHGGRVVFTYANGGAVPFRPLRQGFGRTNSRLPTVKTTTRRMP